nr:hypothetical protein CFP56_16806 [Quercus suber]
MRHRPSVCSGNFEGSDNLAWRAASLADPAACLGDGELMGFVDEDFDACGFVDGGGGVRHVTLGTAILVPFSPHTSSIMTEITVGFWGAVAVTATSIYRQAVRTSSILLAFSYSRTPEPEERARSEGNSRRRKDGGSDGGTLSCVSCSGGQKSQCMTTRLAERSLPRRPTTTPHSSFTTILSTVRSSYHTTAAMRVTQLLRSGGGKIPYPKHVWSPAGGWYSQPTNWRTNTAILSGVLIGASAMLWSLSAEREFRNKMPDADRFFPSRYWSKQIIEHERTQKATKDS